MTVWRKLEDVECYAVAISNYTPSNTTVPHLPLDVGELVHLERETEEWYWGRSLRNNASGAVPKSYLVIRECCVVSCDDDTVIASAGDCGVAHDMSVTLREWLLHWKLLYKTRDERFQFMEVSMRALLKLRADVASGALSQDQLRKVARTAIFTIDKGNRTLDRELAVRMSNGKLVNPLQISSYKLNVLHEETNTRVEKKMETMPPPSPTGASAAAGATRAYSVCVRVHNFVCRVSDPAELVLALHDAAGARLTEHLLMRWPAHAPAQVIFTDLNSDVKREKLFLICQVVRIGSMDAQNVDHKRSSVAQNFAVSLQPSAGGRGAAGGLGSGVEGEGERRAPLRRPFGLACGDVTRHLLNNDPDKHIMLPFSPCEKEIMDSLLKKVITNRDPKDAKSSQGLWVSVQLFEGDLAQVREKSPHTVLNSCVARKMGFPEVILPGDARNDLYVTLCQGSFSKGGKSSERNIEVTARVLDKNGHTLRGVISLGAGMPNVDEYTSMVYYHDDKPKWQEVFKVCLTVEQFKEAHLVFLCRHRSSNEAKDRGAAHFALAYLRLLQRDGTTAPDGAHDLVVYKIQNENKARNPVELELRAGAHCLLVPSRREELPAGAERGFRDGVLSLVYKDSLTISTKLCSTKLTQKEEILGVLKWSAQLAAGSLRAALARLLLVPSEELVKFLQDILDALFNILTQIEEDEDEYTEESYGVLVLDGLLRVVSIVADHKYQHFQPVLHAYFDNSFCDALAYEKLIDVVVWVVRGWAASEGALKRLLQCMKGLEWVVRVLARSRQLRAALGDLAADARFHHQFQSLLEALVWLMRCGDPLLTCQGSALKYLPHAVPHAIKVYPDTELSAHIVRALQALPMERLGKQRVLALLELARGPLAAAPRARAHLLPHLADTARALLRDKAELDRDAVQKSRSVGKAARLLGADTAKLQDHPHHQQIMELCVETIGEVVTLLARDDVGPVEADRGELARRLLPTVLRAAATMLRERDEGAHDDTLLRRMVSILLDLVRQMSLEQYSVVVRALEVENAGASVSLVDESLHLFLTLLKKPVYRVYWADMLHLQHSVMLHALRLISTTLVDRLQSADESMPDTVSRCHATWRLWFSAAGALAASPALQPAPGAARRQRAAALYGDLRRGTAELISKMWFSLDHHKRAFIPSLVGPFLDVSFLEHEEVRNIMIPLFFDMMQTQFNYSLMIGKTEGHLQELESEMVDQVDVLAAGGRGDAAWRARFVSLCGALCGRSAAPLRAAGAALVAAAARQLDTLLQYRAADRPAQMHLITTVLRFYRCIEPRHMYVRYVHRLADMHRAHAQWPEAALALRLHAELLSWARRPLPAALAAPGPAPAAYNTERDLKETLYLEIADLLNRGRQWEQAVKVVKELVVVYEEEALGYGPLGELHAQLAELYGAMLATPRSHPGYFRVLYHGRGFPDHMRHPQVPYGFVYRGNEYEQINNFKERMLDEWPDAEVLPKLDPPGEDITDSDGQYLQINAVEPVMDEEKSKRLSGKPIAEQILQYYKYNDVNKFMFSRPIRKPDDGDDDSNEFAKMWLERTEIVITDKLPGILRWSPVACEPVTYTLSPLQVAVESLREVNRALRACALEARAPDASLQPLTLKLNGILDPAVQGGIVNYEKAFLTPAYEERHPDHAALLTQLKELIVDQIPLLKLGLEVHGARVSPALEQLHAHMRSCFARMQHHVHQRYGRRPFSLEPEPEVQLRAPLRHSADADHIASNRISDISTGNDSVSKSRFFGFNSARNSTTVASYFNTIQTPKRRNKRRNGGKSDLGTQTSSSQWYTSHSTPNGSASCSVNSSASISGNTTPLNELASPLKELRQELVTERPLRRVSRGSGLLPSPAASAPASNRDSMGTTDSNQDDEEPPPLPLKSYRNIDVDIENNNQEPASVRHSYDTVLSPRGSFLYSSMAARRHTNSVEKPPTPPPKKKGHNSCT